MAKTLAAKPCNEAIKKDDRPQPCEVELTASKLRSCGKTKCIPVTKLAKSVYIKRAQKCANFGPIGSISLMILMLLHVASMFW